jgi:hypothetical protein
VGRLTAPQPLSENHVTENFECGNEFLNYWLKKFASINSRANAAKTFVVCDHHKAIALG